MKKSIQSCLITVLTPIYNRADYLEGICNSLVKQSYTDFEWVIVDDGSIDNPKQILERIVLGAEYVFSIRFLRKTNGGKHTAINLGIKEAKGELVLILDSDDTLPQDALNSIVKYYMHCVDKPDCAGVCGLMAHHDGTLIGSGFPKETMYESALEFRYHKQVVGDLLEVFKTSVLREYPFPEISNEKFCPEALVWNRIAQKYKLLCFNKVVYYRDYLEGGLTSKIVRIRMNSPIATTMTYAEMLGYSIPLKVKVRSAINYWRFKFCVKNNMQAAPKVKWYWSLFFPIGLVMHLNDKRING